MAQLMQMPLTVSCFSKIQIGLPFWYRLTQVVLDKGPLNGVCVCVFQEQHQILGDFQEFLYLLPALATNDTHAVLYTPYHRCNLINSAP